MSDIIERLEDIRRQVLWIAMWTIHNANHIRTKIDADAIVAAVHEITSGKPIQQTRMIS